MLNSNRQEFLQKLSDSASHIHENSKGNDENIIKKLLSDGSDIKAAGDWLTWDSDYSKAHKKEFLAAGKKLKNYISLYNQQKENLREKPDSAIFEYEL